MEKRKMKKKGFTLVELLVVIAIIAMLLAILMPALGKVRQMAQRLICGTNIAGIGKAMMVYTNDDEYESYPIAGPSGTEWDIGSSSAEGICSWDWKEPEVPEDGGANDAGTDPTSTISASLYLLVKYADVSPGQFICSGGSEKKFELSKYKNLPTTPTPTIEDVWDFGEKDDEVTSGSRGAGHNSYSYQLPMAIDGVGGGSYPISTTSSPSRAVMADRNPFWDRSRTPGSSATDEGSSVVYLMDWLTITPEKVDSSTYWKGNATAHQKDGQNVLYADSHVKFEKRANCGIEQDNIYTTWGVGSLPTTATGSTGANAIREIGGTTLPAPGNTGPENYPQNEDDSYLVNDYQPL